MREAPWRGLLWIGFADPISSACQLTRTTMCCTYRDKAACADFRAVPLLI